MGYTMNNLPAKKVGDLVPARVGDDELALPLRSKAPEGIIPVLWKRRWLVLASLAICTIAAAAYLLTVTPEYRSTARVYVQRSAPRALEYDERAAGEGETFLFTQAQFLRSAPILEPVLNKPEIAQIPALARQVDPLEYLKEELNIGIGRKDHILDVSFASPDAQQSAMLVNSVVDSYVQYNRALNRSGATELLDVLGREKAARDEELAQKTRALSEYKQKNQTLSFGADQGNVVMQRLAVLSSALTEAELAALSARSMHEAATAVGMAPAKMRRLIELQYSNTKGSNIEPQPDEQQVRSELNRLESQLAVMQTRYGSGHAALRTVKIELEKAKARVAEMDRVFCESYIAATAETWRTAQQKADAIARELQKQQTLAMQLDEKAAEYARLESERNRVEKLRDALDARMGELGVSQQLGAVSVHVLEQARALTRPTHPARATTFGVALVVGLVAGIGLSLFREMTDHRLTSSDEIHDALRLGVLGVIPHMSERQSTRNQVVDRDPMSPVAEAYRAVRTAIHFGPYRESSRSILITSPEEGEGKSTTASNLAIAFAQAGRRVLLVDADLRHPVQHLVFDVRSTAGLMGALAGCAVEQSVSATTIANLDVMTCGAIPANPSEVLASAAFAELLADLTQKYDHVVIDSPPTGAVTDAQILAAQAEATILVLRAQSTTRHSAHYAAEALQQVGGRVLGIVVNDVARRNGGSRYFYGRGAYPNRWESSKALMAAAGDLKSS